MTDKLIESLITNGGLAAVAIALIWRAPTLIRVFMDGKKEVADVMQQQSLLFGGIIEKYETRFEGVESGLKNVCDALKKNQEALEVLLDRDNQKGK